MQPGSVFFDSNFHFHDGDSGEKLFVILGTDNGVSVVAKTTSQPHGKGITFGCQPDDRYHNFYLPVNSCYFKKPTWVCLNEFYEFSDAQLLQKRFSGVVNHICDIPDQITKDLQQCALSSDDMTQEQDAIVTSSLV